MEKRPAAFAVSANSRTFSTLIFVTRGTIPLSDHEHYRPYMYVTVRTAELPGIDERMARSFVQRICWLAIAISALTGCSDLQERHYQDLDAARSDGAFERGWLPEAIPATSSDIREAHDLDTNEGWLVLDFNPDEYLQLPRTYTDAGWRRLSHREIESLLVPQAPVDWWVSDTGLKVDGVDAYTHMDEDTQQRWWALVQREKHRLIAWHYR